MEITTKRSLEDEGEIEVKRMKFDERSILDFSDCVLLNILSFLKSYDLYCLSKTCDRFKYLIKDRKLWRKVDVGEHPMCARKFKFFFENVNNFSDTILVSGISKKEKTLTFSQFAKLNICDNLTVLAIENQYINSDEIALKDFPESLKELSLRGTHIYGRQPFLHEAYLKLLKLHTLILADCKWFHEHSLMALSKLRSLENLSLYKCANLNDSVAYMSITAKFGFRKLLRIDARCTAIGDQFLKCFHCIKTLREIYLEAPDRARQRTSTGNSTINNNLERPREAGLLDELNRLYGVSTATGAPADIGGAGTLPLGQVHHIIGANGASAVVFNRSQLFKMRRDLLKSSKKQKKSCHNQQSRDTTLFNCLENCENCSMETCSFIPFTSNDIQNQSQGSTSSNPEYLNSFKRLRKSDNLSQSPTLYSRKNSSQLESSKRSRESDSLPQSSKSQTKHTRLNSNQSGSSDSNSDQSDAPMSPGREIRKGPRLNITVYSSSNRRSIKITPEEKLQNSLESSENVENLSNSQLDSQEKSSKIGETSSNSQQNHSCDINFEINSSSTSNESSLINFSQELDNSQESKDKEMNFQQNFTNFLANSQQDSINSQLSESSNDFQQSFVNFQPNSANSQQDLVKTEQSGPSSSNSQSSSSNNQQNTTNSQQDLVKYQHSELTSTNSQSNSHSTSSKSRKLPPNFPQEQDRQVDQFLKSSEQNETESSRCSTPEEMLYCDDVSDTEDDDDLDEASGGPRRPRTVSAALLELEMLRSDVSDSGLLWFMGAAPDGSDYTGEPSMLFRPPYTAECNCGAHGGAGSSKKNNGDDGAGPSGFIPSPPPRYNDLTFNVLGSGAVRLKITRSNPSSTSSSDSDSEPGAASPVVAAPPRPRLRDRDDIRAQHHDPRGPPRGRDLRVIIERLDPGVHIVYDHGDVFREYRTKLKVFVARGYKLITNQALRSLMDLRLQLLDVTGTSVNAKGVKDFLLTNPDCRVVHEI